MLEIAQNEIGVITETAESILYSFRALSNSREQGTIMQVVRNVPKLTQKEKRYNNWML